MSDKGHLYSSALTLHVRHLRPAPDQRGVHEEQKQHAADVQVQIEDLVERRRNVRGDDLGHRERDAHDDQQFAVQRGECGGQSVSTVIGAGQSLGYIVFIFYIILIGYEFGFLLLV